MKSRESEMKEVIEVLVKEIHEAARLEIETILRKAEEEAQNILKEAKEKALRIREEKIKEIRRKVREKLLREYIKRKLELRREYLSFREKIIKDLLNEASNKISNIVKEKGEIYKKSLVNLIMEAISQINSNSIQIICKKDDKKVVEELIPQIKEIVRNKLKRDIKIEVITEDLKVLGGIIVYDKINEVYYNNTIDARLRKLEEEILPQILKKFDIKI